MIYQGSCGLSGDFDGRWPIKDEAEGHGRARLLQKGVG